MIKRFSDKVQFTNGCWFWLAFINPAGYGHFFYKKKTVKAHRYAYETLHGKIPDGLGLDHLCCNPQCVNPLHLEPVTNYENHRRGKKVQQTHCHRGHLLSGDNVRIDRRKGTDLTYRRCRTCEREKHQRYAKADCTSGGGG